MHVFLSHSSKDHELVVDHLKPALEAAGLRAWCSSSDLRASDNWEQQIRAALANADWFLVIVTPAAIQSEWVRAETHWAVEHMPTHVVPLLGALCRPIDLHLRLGTLQYVDLRSGLETGLRQILGIIQEGGPCSSVLREDKSDRTQLAGRVPSGVIKVRLERPNAPDYEETLEVRGSAIVGRAPQAHLRLYEDCVSRRHVRLQVVTDSHGIAMLAMDLESANGTRIDGKQLIGAQRLEVGQALDLGGVYLRLLEISGAVGLTGE